MMKVTINDGQNIIQNLSDGFLNALIINRPLAVNWPDCEGSVGEYYSVSNYSTENREKLTNSLNDVLVNGSKDQLFSHFKTFLQLFSSGDYNITLSSLKLTESAFHHEETTKWNSDITQDNRFTCWFYPSEGWDYFFTRPYKSINRKRVDYYINLIKSGMKPKVVIYRLYHLNTHSVGPGYILDGHHKLLAYLELNVDIETVYISKDFLENQKSITDLLPTFFPFLKPVELKHIIQNNPQAYFEKNEFTSFVNATLDNIIINRKHHICDEINRLLIDIINLRDPNYKDWVSARMAALKNNKYIGKGFYLYTKGVSEWNIFLINKSSDIEKWIEIVSKQDE